MRAFYFLTFDRLSNFLLKDNTFIDQNHDQAKGTTFPQKIKKKDIYAPHPPHQSLLLLYNPLKINIYLYNKNVIEYLSGCWQCVFICTTSKRNVGRGSGWAYLFKDLGDNFTLRAVFKDKIILKIVVTFLSRGESFWWPRTNFG